MHFQMRNCQSFIVCTTESVSLTIGFVEKFTGGLKGNKVNWGGGGINKKSGLKCCNVSFVSLFSSTQFISVSKI